MQTCLCHHVWVLCVYLAVCVTATPPHIVLFLADDLGWNDVGFHGSNAISTPNIDALAYSGLALDNYYVTPICTPSRSALFTGKYPIHTGMQHGVIYGSEPRGLPLSEKILPQYLKELGYRTHLVGKWHLGSYKKEYLPLYRGFDSHTGFWTGKIDMYDHTSMEKGSWGFDFRRGFDTAPDLFGKYATDIYTDEAIKVIHHHNNTDPLFLMVAHSAVHSGNPSEFIRAPDSEINKFKHINNYQRQKFAAVLSKMDESIGLVIDALKKNGLLENSIVIFSTDNGGAAAGFNDNAASNYPLRGVKNTLWEGGVRGAGVLWSPLLEKRGRRAAQRMHIVDWLPTLLHAAGGDVSTRNLDGINQWEALSKDLKSNRSVLVHNIDDIWGSASITVDQWKLHIGTNYEGAWDNWYGPGEREETYNIDSVYQHPAGKAMTEMGMMPKYQKIQEMRESTTLKCDDTATKTPCNPLVAPCLFNIEKDPCEFNNLADKEPGILQRLLLDMDRFNATAVPPNNKELDPKGDPKFWGRLYTNFGDYQTFKPTVETYYEDVVDVLSSQK